MKHDINVSSNLHKCKKKLSSQFTPWCLLQRHALGVTVSRNITILIIGVCILLRVYPVMLINHRTQHCFWCSFLLCTYTTCFGPWSVAISRWYVTKYILR
jgi:hypothetical protein